MGEGDMTVAKDSDIPEKRLDWCWNCHHRADLHTPACTGLLVDVEGQTSSPCRCKSFHTQPSDTEEEA